MNYSRKTRNGPKIIAEMDDAMSYEDSNGSFIDSDVESEYVPKKRQRTITNVEEDLKIQRKPTRVPNLKIQNRNALLARENRMRKKQMMEELEQSVEELQAENRKLLKMMKLKDRKSIELTKEVRYLKSVIANRTEIVSVLKSLPKTIVKEENEKLMPTTSYASSETISIDDDDYINNDYDIATEWDDILNSGTTFNSATTDYTAMSKLENGSPAASPTSSGVSSEHNYSYDDKILESIDQEELEEGGAGVCVHINRGKVSLEFCAVCHHNNKSSSAWN